MSLVFKPPKKKELRRFYNGKYPLYKQLIEEVENILSNSIKRSKMKISIIESRVKDFESFYYKIIRKETTGDPFENIEDIAGVRVICLYRSDLEKTEQLIRDIFEVIHADLLHKRVKSLFRYMSDHYVVRLPERLSGERYDAIKLLKCEIQVRTVSMHAWATISHHLDYKQEVDIPSKLKNDFYALSGVLYVADSLFEQIREAREKSIRTLTRSIKLNQFSLDEEMNLDSLKAYLIWKLRERRQVGNRDVSILLSELSSAQINSFRKLDEVLNDHMKWFVTYEKKNPPGSRTVERAGKIEHKEFKKGENKIFNRVGVVRVILKEALQKREVDSSRRNGDSQI